MTKGATVTLGSRLDVGAVDVKRCLDQCFTLFFLLCLRV